MSGRDRLSWKGGDNIVIIIEGPDGAGKTNLVNKISDLFTLPVAEKVVASNMTAMVDLQQWVDENLKLGFQRKIFDRHRLISEPIYGTVIPGREHHAAFWDLDWLMQAMAEFRLIQPTIIYCLPPLKAVQHNLALDRNNVEARPHARSIYHAYVAQACRDPQAMVWDYTGINGSSIESIFFAVERTLRRGHNVV
jgi:hypothetical protein